MEALVGEPAQQAGSAIGVWDTQPHPWRRYGARIIDVQLFGGGAFIGIGILAGLFASDAVYFWLIDEARWKSLLILTPLSWMIAAIIVAMLLTWKGTTPGKLLFGLRVTPADDRPLSLGRAIQREALLLFWGIGFALPLLNLLAGITSFRHVETGEQARWDKAAVLVSEARAVAGWQLVGVIVGTVLVIAALAWSLVERVLHYVDV
nr:RDD family protein [uncultured Sphingomonas sp.]